jgi:DNA-binding CsgD family transcriptional regulator/PAS domain-containing protein
MIRDEADTLSLVGRIYDCVLRPEEWHDVLKVVATSVGGINASISVQDPVSRVAKFSVQWNVPEEAMRSYNEKYASLSPVLTSGWFCELDEAISAARYTGPQQYFESRFAREFLKPLDWGDALGSHIAKLSSRYGILCIMGGWSSGAFEDGELRYIQALSPHIRRAVQISELMGARTSEQTIEAQVLDLLMTGVLLLDGDKRIVYGNPAARSIISASPDLARRGDHLVAADPAAGAKLARAIDVALLGHPGNIPENGIALSLGDNSSIAAWILPLKRDTAREFAGSGEPLVAVFLQEIGSTAPLPGELFVKRYKVTQAECRVLMLLVQGHGTADIADWLGISQTTVKSHLSGMFAKTQTKGQAQLMRLAMTSLSPARMPEERGQ